MVEEKKDKEIIKRQPHLLIIIPVIIIIVSAMFYVVFFNEASEEGVTAMEGLDIAKPIAYDWNNQSELLCVNTITGDMEGKAVVKWRYIFADINQSQELSVYVFPDGSTEFENCLSYLEGTIINWTIDSDEAINISKEIDEIDYFLTKYADERHIEHVNLQLYVDEDVLTWHVEWSVLIDDNNFWATVHVDATTGEVLYVKV